MGENRFPVVGIIPSLNPDEKLKQTVEGLLKAGFTDLIVVDDGSRQDCQSIFGDLSRLPGCCVLHHPENRGKGRALKTGFSYYLNHYDQDFFCGVVTADADGQHLPKDIYETALAVARAEKETCFLALGTRDFDEPSVPFKSRSGNKITTWVFKLLYGKLIHDTQTGLRGISNAMVPLCLDMKGERFEYEINMLIAAARNHYTMEEIPIETVYFDSNRETHFRPFQDSVRIYKVMFASFLKFACSGLFSVLIDHGLFALFLYLGFRRMTDVAAIPLATVLARLGSSYVNFTLNRSLVFSAGKSNRKNLLRYYTLCVLQMAASAAAVTVLHLLTLGNSSLLKLIVDGLLFLASYRIQQAWVFGEK